MRAEDFKELLKARPFVPLRIHLTDGREFEIQHPDRVLVLRSRLVIGVDPDPVSEIFERAEHCSLLHVVRVEEVTGRPAGGPPAEPSSSA